MNPIKHTIGTGDTVLAVDFDRGWLLVSKGGYDHTRLRMVAGVWHRDGGHAYATSPDIDSPEWVPDKHRAAPKFVSVRPECRAVVVHRTDLKSALERISKLSGRSLSTLLTCVVGVDGLTLVSHGASQLVAQVYHRELGLAPVDSLGTVVVSCETLREVVKSMAADKVTVEVGPRCNERRLILDGSREVWTVHARPVAVPTEVDPALTRGGAELSAAILRALPFVMTDASRRSLYGVAFHGKDDHTIVEATDGHRLYRERVSSTAFGSRTVVLPYNVLSTLKPGKRGIYRLAVFPDRVVVSDGGASVTCSTETGHTWPPTAEIVGPALSDDPKSCGWETVEWSPAIVADVRKFFSPSVRAHDKAVHWQITREPKPGAALRDIDDFAWRLVGAGVREASSSDNTPFNIVRGVLPTYFAEGLDAFDKTDTVRVIASENPLDPVYFKTDTRIVCVMPMRL